MVSDVGIEQRRGRGDPIGGLAAALAAPAPRARRDEVDQARLEHLVRLPQLAVVDAVDRAPRPRARRCARPSRGPGGGRRAARICGASHEWHVHAVGDVADRHLVGARARATAAATSAATRRRAAPTRRWRGGSAAAPAPSCRTSRRGSAGRRGRGPCRSSLGEAQRVAQRAEVLLDQRRGEAVVPGGHRRVRGEDGHARRRRRHASSKRQAVGLHRRGGSSRGRRRRCAPRSGAARRARCPARAARARRRRPAPAPGGCGCAIAAVEPRGQLAVFRAVPVARSQSSRSRVTRPTVDPPDPGEDRAGAGLDRDQRPACRRPPSTAVERQLVDVERRGTPPAASRSASRRWRK